jgi:threonine/homoserine/homoserine lactone efflux protein
MLEMLLLGFVIGLTGALAPGPTLVAAIQSAVKGGWPAGPKISLGHIAVETVLFVIVVFWLGSSSAIQAYAPYIAVVGGIALVAFGILTIRGSTTATLGGDDQGRGGDPVMAGVVTSASNPYFWIWWLTVGSAFLLAASRQSILMAVAFIVGHWGADIGWYTLVSTGIHQGRSILDQKTYTRILALCGIFLVLFGLYYLLSAVTGM